LELPDEYPDDDYRYVDPERIVRERIEEKQRVLSVHTGMIAFQALMGSIFVFAIGMNLTKSWRMAG